MRYFEALAIPVSALLRLSDGRILARNLGAHR